MRIRASGPGRAEKPSTGGSFPRLARLLASTLIRDPSVEFIVGDLDEAYIHERAAGKRGARLRYWRLALASIWSRSGSTGSGGRRPQDSPSPRRAGSVGCRAVSGPPWAGTRINRSPGERTTIDVEISGACR